MQCTRKVGRPKGARDGKPRKKRWHVFKKEADITSETKQAIDYSMTFENKLSISLPPNLKDSILSSIAGLGGDDLEWMEGTVLTHEAPDPFHGDWPYWSR